MKNAIKYILILIILILIFIILNFYKSKKDIFDDIMIFELWGGNSIKKEYEINSQNTIETEKTSKPQNLVFSIENRKYLSLKEMEDVINKKFINTDRITINWEWKYYIDEIHDIQDTKDGERVQKYLFEIEAIVEEEERTEI